MQTVSLHRPSLFILIRSFFRFPSFFFFFLFLRHFMSVYCRSVRFPLSSRFVLLNLILLLIVQRFSFQHYGDTEYTNILCVSSTNKQKKNGTIPMASAHFNVTSFDIAKCLYISLMFWIEATRATINNNNNNGNELRAEEKRHEPSPATVQSTSAVRRRHAHTKYRATCLCNHKLNAMINLELVVVSTLAFNTPCTTGKKEQSKKKRGKRMKRWIGKE